MRAPRWMVLRAAMVVGTAVLTVCATAVSATAATPPHADGARHVLLISIDGLHQSDLDWYVRHRPASALAALTRVGVDYTRASTPVPADSFPGMIAQATGGNPATTGVYYDSVYNRALLPAGTTSCAGRRPGADVDLTEAADRDQHALDAGQGLPGLPDAILGMTGQPRDVLDPAKLPVDPRTCTPLAPHQYLQVNTIFEVARAHGLRTAWSDKHPAYEILDGPSGNGVQDLFTPEINSQVVGLPDGVDWTADNRRTQQYDGYKAQAVRNELDGYDHSRSARVGVPAVLGMNFQTVSTGQKLPTSNGAAGGYLADGTTPGPVLSSALDFVDSQLAGFQAEIDAQGLRDSTTIIVSAKHGQSPTDPGALNRIDDAPILNGLNTAWKAAHHGAGDLVAHSTADDSMLLWLTDRSPAATDFARSYLLAQHGSGRDIAGKPRPFTSSGLTAVHAGPAAARYFGTAPDDPRVPDLVGIGQHGVVYTGGTSKIAEHGGADAEDRAVPIVVVAPGGRPRQVAQPVGTTQIAPTVLRALGLDPSELQAVRREHTPALDG